MNTKSATKGLVYESDSDEFYVETVVIDHLVGGFGQVSQQLDEPIVIDKFQRIHFDTLVSPKYGDQVRQTHKRSCRKCHSKLPSSRFFTCKKCQPILEDEYSMNGDV